MQMPIAWPYKEFQIHLLISPYIHFQRRARKVRDIMSLRKKAIDDEHKKKRSLMSALKQARKQWSETTRMKDNTAFQALFSLW